MHGAALGLVNWGIYFGYGVSFLVGRYIPPLDILGQVSSPFGFNSSLEILSVSVHGSYQLL